MARNTKTNAGANLGFEVTLWAADKLRGHVDAAEYKYVVLGLIFLEYISDAFEEVHTKLCEAVELLKEDSKVISPSNTPWPNKGLNYLIDRLRPETKRT